MVTCLVLHVGELARARSFCVQHIYAVCLQPLFGATAVLPPTRFCRESCAYCVCKATLLARTCHFPFSKSILAPCAPPAGSVNDVDASLRPFYQGCAPTNRRHSCPFFSSLFLFSFLALHLDVSQRRRIFLLPNIYISNVGFSCAVEKLFLRFSVARDVGSKNMSRVG